MIGANEEMKLPRTNIVQQVPYRKRLAVGDVFVMRYPDDRYLFGRIMRLDAAFGGFASGCIKTHIYSFISNTPSPPEGLTSKPLLTPPQWINRLGFSRGYLTVAANVPVSSGDTQDHACYRNWRGQYVTEDGRVLEQPTDIVGGYGLGNYRTVDDAISKALGIRLAKD